MSKPRFEICPGHPALFKIQYWFNVYPVAANLSASQAGPCVAQDPTFI